MCPYKRNSGVLFRIHALKNASLYENEMSYHVFTQPLFPAMAVWPLNIVIWVQSHTCCKSMIIVSDQMASLNKDVCLLFVFISNDFVLLGLGCAVLWSRARYSIPIIFHWHCYVSVLSLLQVNCATLPTWSPGVCLKYFWRSMNGPWSRQPSSATSWWPCWSLSLRRGLPLHSVCNTLGSTPKGLQLPLTSQTTTTRLPRTSWKNYSLL